MKKSPKVVELDFGMGNIRSLQKAFEYIGQPVEVIKSPDAIAKADALIIPGDGAFGQAMENIKAAGFYEPVKKFIQSGKPVLGICIGFQILFESSEEFSYEGSGFSAYKGKIKNFSSLEAFPGFNIPHMGWNEVHWNRPSLLSKGIPDKSFFYFVHSFCFPGAHEDATGTTEYGLDFTSVVEKDNVFAVQFHPEKSYKMGLRLIENFVRIIECN